MLATPAKKYVVCPSMADAWQMLPLQQLRYDWQENNMHALWSNMPLFHSRVFGCVIRLCKLCYNDWPRGLGYKDWSPSKIGADFRFPPDCIVECTISVSVSLVNKPMKITISANLMTLLICRACCRTRRAPAGLRWHTAVVGVAERFY